MYSKLFSTIFDGSMYGKFEPLTVFMAMLALANRHGEVDVAPAKIAGCLGCDLAFVQKGIEALMAPDEASRTPTEDGRRLLPLLNDEGNPRPWGWKITNYAKYRSIRSEDERREYKRDWDRTHRGVAKVSDVSESVGTDKSDQRRPGTTYTEAEAEALHPTPVTEIVALYHELMPGNPKMKVITEERRKHIRARWMDAGLLDLKPFNRYGKAFNDPKAEGLQAWRLFFETCAMSPFLTNKVERSEAHSTFRVDLNWIMNPNNFAKIMENKYHRGGK